MAARLATAALVAFLAAQPAAAKRAVSRWEKVQHKGVGNPSPRGHHIAAAVVVEGGPQQLGMGFMIHGGCADHACTKPLDDAWLMQPVDKPIGLPWREMPHGTKQLGPRGRHAACIDKMDDSVFYVFGGTTGGMKVQNDLWQFIGAQGGIWLELKPVTAVLPPARMDHAMIYGGGQVLVYGGRSGTNAVLEDMWSYDNDGSHGHAHAWRQKTPAGYGAAWPGARFLPLWTEYLDSMGQPYGLLHGGAYIPASPGPTDYAPRTDLWRLDIKKGVWTEINQGGTPAGRWGHSGDILQSYNTERRLVIAAGAGMGGTVFEDSWECVLPDTLGAAAGNCSWLVGAPVGGAGGISARYAGATSQLSQPASSFTLFGGTSNAVAGSPKAGATGTNFADMWTYILGSGRR